MHLHLQSDRQGSAVLLTGGRISLQDAFPGSLGHSCGSKRETESDMAHYDKQGRSHEATVIHSAQPICLGESPFVPLQPAPPLPSPPGETACVGSLLAPGSQSKGYQQTARATAKLQGDKLLHGGEAVSATLRKGSIPPLPLPESENLIDRGGGHRQHLPGRRAPRVLSSAHPDGPAAPSESRVPIPVERERSTRDTGPEGVKGKRRRFQRPRDKRREASGAGGRRGRSSKGDG